MKQIDCYFSKKWNAYCASENFDNNNDVYYDDNAQVASALVGAWEVTGDQQYLQKARVNVNFLVGGWQDGRDNAPHGQGKGAGTGGVRWHVDKNGCNACTTAECALAALRVARHSPPDRQRYTDFAIMCCRWIIDHLQDPEDFLICDGLEPVSDKPGEYRRNGAKWTYNQGTTLSLCSMLYGITRQDYFKQRAQEIANAVTNRNTEIFDRNPSHMGARYYHDSVYFYQLLAEGFADFALYFEGKSPQELVERVKAECLHHLSYVFCYLRDPRDGLYFQTLELWKINESTYEAYKRITGCNHAYEPSGGEREHNDKISVEKRAMTKSLIGSGGASRIFFQSARLFPHFVPQ